MITVRTEALYRVCLCPEGKHISLPDDWRSTLDTKGNPTNPPWCTSCPLACFEVVRSLLPEDDFRSYPRWLETENRFSLDNYGKKKMFPFARRWLDLQGANPDGLVFDSNGGRKALGKWCDEFGVPYTISFEVHGDLWKTWKRHYQEGLDRNPYMERRTQSNQPDVACAALRMFARAIGRGRTVREDPNDFTQAQIGQLLVATLRKLGASATVASILDPKL